jgi:hypothetical protein
MQPGFVNANVQLALQRRQQALDTMDSENAKLRGSGFNLELAVGPNWDRSIWESYKAQFGEYPFNEYHRPPDVLNAPAWVKAICGIKLNPAEKMQGRL